jgi:hypothetical protein
MLTKDFASDINRMPHQEKKGNIWEINEFTCERGRLEYECKR